MSAKFAPVFGCGTGYIQYLDKLSKLKLQYAIDVNDINGIIAELQFNLFGLSEDSNSLNWLVSLIREEYTDFEITRELKNLVNNLEEIDLRKDNDDLPYSQYKTTLFGSNLTVASESYFMTNEKVKLYCLKLNLDTYSSICKLDYLKNHIINSYFYQELGG